MLLYVDYLLVCTYVVTGNPCSKPSSVGSRRLSELPSAPRGGSSTDVCSNILVGNLPGLYVCSNRQLVQKIVQRGRAGGTNDCSNILVIYRGAVDLVGDELH